MQTVKAKEFALSPLSLALLVQFGHFLLTHSHLKLVNSKMSRSLALHIMMLLVVRKCYDSYVRVRATSMTFKAQEKCSLTFIQV